MQICNELKMCSMRFTFGIFQYKTLAYFCLCVLYIKNCDNKLPTHLFHLPIENFFFFSEKDRLQVDE